MFVGRYSWLRKYVARWFRPAPSARRIRLKLEWFEDRTVPATFTVTDTSDTNPTGGGNGGGNSGDLRYCIIRANSAAGADTVDATGVVGVISLSAALPPISDSVTISGPALDQYGQPQLDIQRNPSLSTPDFRVIDISNASAPSHPALNVLLQRLAIEGGRVEGGTVQGTDTGGGLDGAGGGVRFVALGSATSSLAIEDCSIQYNTVYGLQGGTDAGGNAYGGGVFTKNVALTITDSAISNNYAQSRGGQPQTGSAFGGGLYATGKTVTVTNGVFDSNVCMTFDPADEVAGNGFGGGVSTQDTTLTMTGTVLSHNRVYGSIALANVSLHQTYQAGNAYGGGLYHNGGTAVLSDLSMIGNLAAGGVAEAEDAPSSDPTINGGTGDGGGIYAVVPAGVGYFAISDSEVRGNTAQGGYAAAIGGNNTLGGAGIAGGLDVLTTDANDNVSAAGSAYRCAFALNQSIGGIADARGDGNPYYGGTNDIGGGTASGGSAYTGGVIISQLTECTVANNTATGGDAYVDFYVTTVTGGAAAGGGYGGPSLASLPQTTTYTVSNSTIGFNVAFGGMGHMNFTSNSLQADAMGGGLDDGNATTNPSANVVLYSTIVAQNAVNSNAFSSPIGTNGAGPDIIGCGTIGHNFIGDRESATYEPNFPQDTGFNFVVPNPNSHHDLVGPLSDGVTPYDPLFNPLAVNGGPSETLSLQAASPAIDNGANDGFAITYDQRGYPYIRSYGLTGGSAANYDDGTDVGAFEAGQPLALTYADTRWANFSFGEFIPDADPVAPGNQPATFGVTAFASVNAAVAAVGDYGEVVVNGDDTGVYGDFAEPVALDRPVTLDLQAGAVAFDSLAGSSSAAGVVLDGVSLSTDGDSNSDPYDGTITGNGGPFSKVGTGTLPLVGADSYSGDTDIDAGVLQLGANGVLPSGTTVLLRNVSGTALDLNGHTQTIASLTGGGSSGGGVLLGTGALTVNGTLSTIFSGTITGGGSLTKDGTSTLTLAASNSYSGGTSVQGGILRVAADANLGAGNVSGGPLGVLAFTGTTTTTKSYAMSSGTITVAQFKTVTFNGSQVSNTYLDGSGTYATSAINGAHFVNDTSTASAHLVSNSSNDQFQNFSNNGTLTVTAGVNISGTSTTINFNDFTNQGLGSLTVGASSQVNVSNFQSYGTVTLSPGTSSNPTQLTNLGSSELAFVAGSRTFISVVANSSLLDAGIDLHGQNARVTSGFLKNCGYVVDSVGAGTKAIIADFGSLVQSTGFLQNNVQTVNGGKFQSGDCPGRGYVGRFTFGSAGVNDYLFQMTDATGAAGPTPDADGHTDGWSLVEAGDLTWSADSNQKLTVNLQTLSNTTTVGNDIAGPMDNFDPTKSYAWEALHWTGTYTGPTDVAALNAATAFDTTGFANSVNGTFSWQLDLGLKTLSLVYTPNP